jgi:hypothetical protein
VNREHYAALLVLYYRLFQENARSLERELVIREFMNYFALHHDISADESDDETESISGNSAEKNRGEQELDFGKDTFSEKLSNAKNDERILANRFLRRLINSGWLGEETLVDFTRVINITSWGKPFIKALADVDGGLKTEYESHVVTVYSMLCGESVTNDGHHAVLKAHEEARSLIDSLKVLSQSIKGYYDSLNAETIRSKAASALHEHYDLYMGEVLDKAYKRLKTSDNVSRYRQGIFKQVAKLLHDDEWLDASAAKYMRILQTSREECREKLTLMLEDIRDDLKSVDPLEDEIDRRNAAYSRSSTEIIKAYIEPDTSIAGKLGILIKALYKGDDTLHAHLAHNINRITFFSPNTVSLHRPRDEAEFDNSVSNIDLETLEQNEKDFFDRMKKRLSIKKIGTWLDDQGGKDNTLLPTELINDEESYIRFIYALLYGDSRNDFSYLIEENESDSRNKNSVQAADYIVPNIQLRHEKKEMHESGY